MTDQQPPPLKVWQGALVSLLVAVLIWIAYAIYHVFWGALAH